MAIFCTTIKNYDATLLYKAKHAAKTLRIPYVDRNEFKLLQCVQQGNSVLVYEKETAALHSSNGILRFHLNMAALRIATIRNGKHDSMLMAMNVSNGSAILDCTFGLGSDAIVAAYAAGPDGNVTGLEKSMLLQHVIEYGLKQFLSDDPGIAAALSRINLHCYDYRVYLKKAAANSYDIVYFDPMFVFPQKRSNAIAPLRDNACMDQLDELALNDAIRVARKRVVVKLEKYSKTEVEFDEITGGKYAAARYGVILTNR